MFLAQTTRASIYFPQASTFMAIYTPTHVINQTVGTRYDYTLTFMVTLVTTFFLQYTDNPVIFSTMQYVDHNYIYNDTVSKVDSFIKVKVSI